MSFLCTWLDNCEPNNICHESWASSGLRERERETNKQNEKEAREPEDRLLSSFWSLVSAELVSPLAFRVPQISSCSRGPFFLIKPPIGNNCSHFVFRGAVIFAQRWAPFTGLLTEMGSDRLNKRKPLCQGNRYYFSPHSACLLLSDYSVPGICRLWAYGHTKASYWSMFN